MLRTLLFVFLVFSSFISFSQNDFPDSWVGNYKGELEIYGKNDVRMLVNMQLEIQPKTDSLFTWYMIYEMNGNPDKRMYELKILDKDKGHYLIDEKNTILIDGYYHLNRFTSMFEVMGSYIVTTYTMENEALVFEIIAGSMKAPRVTGNQEHEGNDIPEVKTYSVNGRQKAVLYKVN
jgi:hypothetical protein